MKKRPIILITIFVLLFVVPSLVGLLTDWLWFKEVGFENIFTTILSTKLLLGVGVGCQLCKRCQEPFIVI